MQVKTSEGMYSGLTKLHKAGVGLLGKGGGEDFWKRKGEGPRMRVGLGVGRGRGGWGRRKRRQETRTER